MRKLYLSEAIEANRDLRHYNGEAKFNNLSAIRNFETIGDFLFPDEITWRNLSTNENADLITSVTKYEDTYIKHKKALFETLGVNILSDQEQMIIVPKIKESADAEWIVPFSNNDITEVQPISDAIEVKAKLLSATMYWAKTLLKMTNPNLQKMILEDMYASLNRSVSKAMFYGSGVDGEPSGLINDPDIKTTSGIDYTMETALEQIRLSNLENDNEEKYFVVHPDIYKILANRQIISGNSEMINNKGTIDKYKVISSHLIGNTDVWFGDFSTILLVLYGKAVDVIIDQFSSATSGTNKIMFQKYLNFAFRSPEAIVLANNFS